MESATAVDKFGSVSFSPDESWFKIGPPGERRRVGFHDYAAIYAEPGLYERVFIEELGMRSTFEVVRLFGEALRGLDKDPAEQRVRGLGTDPRLLEPGGLYAFAVMPALLPGSEDEAGLATGYPDYLTELLAHSEELAREAYGHRRQADGSPHEAVALVGRV